MDINKYAADFVDQMYSIEEFEPISGETFFDQTKYKLDNYQKFFVCDLIDHIDYHEKHMVDVWFKHLFWLLIRYIEIDKYRDDEDIISTLYKLSTEFDLEFFQFKLYENEKIKDYVLGKLSSYYDCNNRDEFCPEFKAKKIISGEYLECLCEGNEFGENVKYWIRKILNDFRPSWANESYTVS